MIKDQYLRIIFIPLLGIAIPLLSGLIAYNRYSVMENIGAGLYFIFVSFAVWEGCRWMHPKLRSAFKIKENPFYKIISVCLVSALYGAIVTGLFAMAWFAFSKETFDLASLTKSMILSSFAVILFSLVYEILFLSKERELDNKIVDQLDHERTQAEMTVLRNELDPHFIFNSLNALSHLIMHDPPKAHQFNSNLAKVYKYFLLNKDRELISLSDELEFIQNYFFLLQIRHDNKLHLNTALNGGYEGTIMILPCALQLLVENAIKHNEFTDANPLHINITLNGQFIKVSNNARPKTHLVNSTRIGLRNLSARYRLVCNKDIVIETKNETFAVKLPLINNL